MWAGASPELGKKRARGATVDPVSGMSQASEEMSLTNLRQLADSTPGMLWTKKVEEKWVNKQKEELVEDFKACYANKSAQPLAGSKTDLDKRL